MKRNLGMWIFLATEVLLFGVLIFLYNVNLFTYEDVFLKQAKHLHFHHGTVNTVVLLTSSYFVALADHTKKRFWLLLAFTLGALFLGIKSYEYYDLTMQGRFPLSFHHSMDPNFLFFTFYAFLTFLHSIHVIIGMGALLVVWWIKSEKYQEGVGLYWHFVDIVWVFLYPLFYLAGHHGN